MTRRDFITKSSAGLTASMASASSGTENSREHLPVSQGRPLPDLGSHWPLFEKLSEHCVPAMSFLRDEFSDPRAWSEHARGIVRSHLCYEPPSCLPRPEVVGRVDKGDFIRERVLINTTPDIRIPVYVLIPAGVSLPAPAVVALHDHGGFYFWGKEKLVEVTPEHPELRAFKQRYYDGRSIADELARRGFVVIVSDMLHWGERGLYLEDDPVRIKERSADVTPQDIREFNARSWAHEELVSRTAMACGVTWAGINIMDDYRVTDYLLTRKEVDASRVGCIGLSLGSVRSIFLGALHPAVRASVAVCWMAEYQGMIRNNVRNGIGYTKLVPGLYTHLDWPDVASLHWPGALMTINGLKDELYPLEAAKAAVHKLERIFVKAGTPGEYTGIFFDGPHSFPAEMQERAFEWLSEHLAS